MSPEVGYTVPAEVRLRVAEALSRDVGRKIARISREVMARLGVEVGDYIEIEGPRGIAVAQVWPLHPDERDRNIIRIDGYMREAIGASVGDMVTVRKAANVQPATRVVLAPTEPIRFAADFPEYVKEYLLRKPLARGETVVIPVFSTGLKLVVVSTQPSQFVYVTRDTEIEIREEPVREERIHRGIPRVTWEDIGDLEEAKEKIREIVELPMKHPELFEHLGIEPPKGILLYGPPGVGKTLLAKALANEIGAYFIAINGPEIMSKYYGESEQRLREIFEEAEKNAPSIIFIDEIDAIAPRREEVTGEVEKRVVAQLLTLMDGLKERGRVIVIGATNRPDAIDPALRRPGRFDREIEIRPPDKRARKEILQVHVRNMPLADDVDLDKIAEMTHGYTGADLAALAKEAAMNALRRFIKSGRIDLNKPIPAEVLRELKVTMADFLEAMRHVQPSLIREIYIEVPEVHWDDIGGLDDVKQQLREAIEWPLTHPELFEQMGVRPPKGILLFGPPGTGKTLLAKAAATESGANFIAVRGPEILSKWVGESEKAIRQIFRRARQVAPAIIFFDEIDAIAPARGMRYDTSGVTDRIVNQLLTEMDGIEPLTNVVVIAATNRPDILDPALLRPGRFDRLIYVPPPDKKSRLEILRIHTRRMPLAEDVDLELIAEKTEGYTGADLEAVCREAAMIALRETFKKTGKPQAVLVRMEHFEKALQAIPPSLTPEDIRRYERLAKELKRMVT
ncbi:ATPases of AAA+ class, SpoVK, putative cell division [Hyperthermus butylicus DSM 5456]|uniref:ATPases of AAA+ class, SpoVK, putative cell division n=1 Tax=Hyperthermus butylicus (strain DSM 5456 / JCM 9403 / PLM1-5) TaxID=415426 RepID=A2BJL1_HYPBU|nr:ATPases of AAA+ class, SpoVK, putative cell division [Hyperthermus butylicus DSM 5456]